MSGSNARSNAIRAITSYKPDLAPLNYADTKPTEIYGSNVFSDKVMNCLLYTSDAADEL